MASQSSKQADVVLIHPITLSKNPPSIPEKNYWDAMKSVGKQMGDQPEEPPLGLLYVGASLQAAGISVQFIDFNLMDATLRNSKGKYLTLNDIREVLSTVKPKIIGISAMTTQEKWLIDVANLARELHPTAEIIVGGIHPTFQAEPLLRKCDAIDVVVLGEGETTMRELALGKAKEEILGITYRANGQVVSTPPRPLLSPDELDNLPFPAYNLLAPEAFPLVPRVLAARGCPGQCEFCVVNKFFKNRPRCRNSDRVVDEIEWLLSNFNVGKTPEYGVPFFVWGDLSVDRKSMPICDEIIARGIEVNWWCQTRADIIAEGKIDLKKMYEAGCRYIAIGIESASEEQLEKTKKGITRFQSIVACHQAKKAGMLVQGYFVIGLPDETITSAYKTINLMDELMREGLVDVTHISVAVLYPGTSMFTNPEKYGYILVSRNFEEFVMCSGEGDGGLPPYETINLSRHQIYSLWQLALSVAAKNYRMRQRKSKGKREDIPKVSNVSRVPDFQAPSGI